ncbi:MAG: heme o synthase [Candidatus Nanopelagicales bacterium]
MDPAQFPESSLSASAAASGDQEVVPQKRVRRERTTRVKRPTRSKFSAYLALTKPRIIELLLVTTVPTMFLAAGGFPGLWVTVATLIGGALAAGGANTLNCYIDRDIDAVMKRTGHRPLVTGEVTPNSALVFGLVLSVASALWLAVTVNLLSAVLASGAIAFYVIIYTLGLKRRTAQNIVWGGAAGCFPVLIGWSAVTNTLSWAALVLFMVIFLWTPPHYWPLAIKNREDYATAGVPMLPVVASNKRVAVETVIYSWAMVACSLVLIPVAQMGWVYTIAAIVTGGFFIFEAQMILRRVIKGVDPKPMRLFHYSITYLSLLFLAIAIDPFF